MRTIAEIDSEIAQVRGELQNVHGSSTEVYARIVGYYRSVRNWNQGKREEYNHRKLFVADESSVRNRLDRASIKADLGLDATRGTTTGVAESTDRSTEAAATAPNAAQIDHYELFTRRTCPNCPPVKECCSNLPLSGSLIDVDTDAGYASAAQRGIMSTPTVVFCDAAGVEVSRAYSVKEIRALPALADLPTPALF